MCIAILREELDKMDFSDVSVGTLLAAVHSGRGAFDDFDVTPLTEPVLA